MTHSRLPSNRRPSGKAWPLLIAVLMAAFTLLSLGVLAHVSETPDATPGDEKSGSPATSVVTALDVQRIQLPTGPGFVLILGVMAPGEEPVELAFRSGQQYDFIVRQQGREVWRWSTGRVFHQAFHKTVIEAGTLRTFVHVWDGRNGADELISPPFEIEARLMTDTPLGTSEMPSGMTNRVTIEIDSLPAN